jgi:hypothetical protein
MVISWNYHLYYISLKSEILTAINIRTADCRDVTVHIPKNLLPHLLPWWWTKQVPQQNICNNLPNQAVLKLGSCFTICPLQAKSYSTSTKAQAHTMPKFLPSRYHVGCLFISVHLVVRHTVCTVRCLQLIVICCIHIHICRTGCYRYAMCTFRYIQPVIADTPIKKCSDTLQELTEHTILLHN